MKKIVIPILGVIMMFVLSGCTIDWHDEKANEINLLNAEIASLKLKIEDQSFEKNLKCQSLLDGLKRKYNNVFSIYYSEYGNTCYIKYNDTKTKELMEAPMDNFGPN